jgi:hypothetical protein
MSPLASVFISAPGYRKNSVTTQTARLGIAR